MNTPIKRCSTCGRELPIKNFKKDPRYTTDGHVGQCYECRNSIRHARDVVNRDKIREQQKQWKSANHDKELAKQKRYRDNNPDKVKQKLWKWRQTIKGKIVDKIHTNRRKARKQQLSDTYTDQDWQRTLEYFGGRCAVCGRPAGLWHTIAADHWIPLSSQDCTGTIPTNIVPLCHGDGGCNNSKHNRDPIEWLEWKFGKRKAKQIARRIEEFFNHAKHGYSSSNTG